MQRGLPAKRALEGVGRVLLVASGKGGVGKSTVAANLAMHMAARGRRVGLLDADLCGPSVPRLMGLLGARVASEPAAGRPLMVPVASHGVRCMSMGFLVGPEAPVVWRGLMVMKAVEQLLFQVQWGPLDLLVVDMPPGTGDTQLSVTQLAEVAGALLVTTPQELALADARRAAAMFAKVGVPVLGYVENMAGFVCPACAACSPLFPQGRPLAGLRRLAALPVDAALAARSDAGAAASSPVFAGLAEAVDRLLLVG